MFLKKIRTMQNKSLLLLFIALLIGFNPIEINAQRKSKKERAEAEKNAENVTNPNIASTPKLVVGIVAVSYTHLTLPTTPYV